MKTITKLTNVLSILVGAFLFIGAVFLFQCPPMESGSYMNCHNANIAVAVLSAIIVLLGILLMIPGKRAVSICLSAVAVVAAVVSALTPGILVQLCMMPEMTCRSVFRPVDVVCSVVLLIVGVIRCFAVSRDRTPKD